MKHGRCRLCCGDKELCDSHIVPEFLYAAVYDEKHRLKLIPDTTERRPRYEQLGLREPLLCKSCENTLSDWEGHARQVMYETDRYEQVAESRRLVIKGVDYKKMKLFQLSLLWRAGISKLESFRNVCLGPHEERIRRRLLDRSPGAWDIYPSPLLLAPSLPSFVARSITPPMPFKFEGHRAYRFSVGSLFIAYVVSRNSHEVVEPRAVLSEAGELPVLLDIDNSTVPLIRQMAEEMIRLREMHSV